MTEHIIYVTNSLAWSFGGLVVGYILGKIENVQSRKRPLDEEVNDHS